MTIKVFAYKTTPPQGLNPVVTAVRVQQLRKDQGTALGLQELGSTTNDKTKPGLGSGIFRPAMDLTTKKQRSSPTKKHAFTSHITNKMIAEALEEFDGNRK